MKLSQLLSEEEREFYSDYDSLITSRRGIKLLRAYIADGMRVSDRAVSIVQRLPEVYLFDHVISCRMPKKATSGIELYAAMMPKVVMSVFKRYFPSYQIKSQWQRTNSDGSITLVVSGRGRENK